MKLNLTKLMAMLSTRHFIAVVANESKGDWKNCVFRSRSHVLNSRKSASKLEAVRETVLLFGSENRRRFTTMCLGH